MKEITFHDTHGKDRVLRSQCLHCPESVEILFVRARDVEVYPSAHPTWRQAQELLTAWKARHVQEHEAARV